MLRLSLLCLIFSVIVVGCYDDKRVIGISQNPNNPELRIFEDHPEWTTWIDINQPDIVRIDALKAVIWESGIIYNEDLFFTELVTELAQLDKRKNESTNREEILLMTYLNGNQEAIDALKGLGLIKSDTAIKLNDDEEVVDLDIVILKNYLVEASKYLSRKFWNLSLARKYLEPIDMNISKFENDPIFLAVYNQLKGLSLDIQGELEGGNKFYIRAIELYDSLEMKSMTVNVILTSAAALLYSDIKEFTRRSELAFNICDSNNYWYQKLDAISLLSLKSAESGEPEEATELLNQILEFDDRDTTTLDFIGTAYIQKMFVHLERPNEKELNKAFESMQYAREIYARSENPRRIGSRDLLYNGISFLVIEQIDSARFYLEEGLKIAIKNEHKKNKGTYVRLLAELEFDDENYEEALKYYKEAEEDHKNMGAFGFLDLELGRVYLKLKNYKEAEGHLLKSKVFFDNEYNDIIFRAEVYDQLCKLYKETDRVELALEYGQQGLGIAERLNEFQVEHDIRSTLMDIYKNKEDYKSALVHSKRFSALSDSLVDLERLKEIGRIEAKMNFTTSLNAQEEITKGYLLRSNKEKHIINLYSIIASLILLIFTIYVWVRSSQIKLLESVASHEKQNAINLKELGQQRTRIMADISHDFRTSLNMIQAPLSDMIKGSFKANFKESWINMKANADVLLQLVNQMLELSELDEGFLKPKYKSVDIVKLIDKRMASFLPNALLDDITLVGNFPSESFMLITEDNFINKIVNNLLSNAIKYSKQGGRVELSLGLNKESLTITVEDDGIGMSEEEMNNIFGRYQRLNKEKIDEILFPGGLGLSIVDELTTLLKGDISVQSEPDQGTTFIVTIPHLVDTNIPVFGELIEKVFTSESSKAIETNRIEEGAKYLDQNDRDKKLILIVEDNHRLNDFISYKLADDFRVLQSFNGEEGEKMAIDRLPDIILTDVMMPRKNGIDMAESLSINLLTSHIPTIFFSMNYKEEHRIRAFKSGGIDFLEKPVSTDLLILKINNLLSFLDQLQSRVVSKIDMNEEVITFQDDDLSEIDQEFLRDMIQVIISNLHDSNFNVNELCKLIFMSRSQSYRKIKGLTGLTPKTLILKYRMENAMKLLSNRSESIEKIGNQVGFVNFSHFSRTFSEYYGIKPSQVPNTVEK